MTPRQAYAITHPITDPGDPQELARINVEATTTRRHPKGQHIMSILAVDR